MEKAAETQANAIENELQDVFQRLEWFGLNDLANRVTELQVDFRAWRRQENAKH